MRTNRILNIISVLNLEFHFIFGVDFFKLAEEAFYSYRTYICVFIDRQIVSRESVDFCESRVEIR
jgi:hypothetical protein